MRLPGLHGLSIRDAAVRTHREFLRDDMLTYAAALAYHLLFAVFPFLLFLLAVLGFFDLQGLFEGFLRQAEGTLPEPAVRQIEQVLSEVTGGRAGLVSFGAVLSVWFASMGMRSVMNALNRAYDVEEGRPPLRRYALSVGFTLAFAALVALATGLMAAGPAVAIAAADRLGLGAFAVQAWRWLRMPAAMALSMLAAATVYHFAPNLERRFRFATAGSVVAVLLWVAVSWGFRLYVAHFGRYSVVYGSVGAVIVLLLYFFLSAVALLVGGELNGVIHRHARGGRGDGP